MKYLITGLGNIGEQYAHTRHNIGFDILDAFSGLFKSSFSDGRYGFVTQVSWKGRIFVLLKPSTYVNLSGRAVNYHLKRNKISLENLLVVVDDISLPFGMIRLRPSGGDGGHNGLMSINEIMGTQNYSRLRFGIGSEFPKGWQVQHVLGQWDEEEKETLTSHIEKACDAIKSFGTIGMERTMNIFNKK